MSKGKGKPTKRNSKKKLLMNLIVVFILSTLILAIVSYILTGNTSILFAIVDLLTKVLDITVSIIALYQMNYL